MANHLESNRRNPQKSEKVYGARKIAELLGLSPKTVYKLARQGKLPCRRAGRKFLFRLDAVLEWLENDQDKHE